MSNIPLHIQEGVLKSYFPTSKIYRKGDYEITWTHTLTPSPLSNEYKIQLHYKKGDGAKVYVLEPKPLALAIGENVLPHVYSTPDQRLCLYYPTDKEWTPSMFYAKTLIPWACEWLLHYELWVITGTWHGGGIDHNEIEEKRDEE